MKQIRHDPRQPPEQNPHRHWRLSMEMASPEIAARMRALAQARHKLWCRRAEIETLLIELKKREGLLARVAREEVNKRQPTCECETLLGTSGQGDYVKEHAVSVHVARPESSSSQFTEAVTGILPSHTSDDFSLGPGNATGLEASSQPPAQQRDTGEASASMLSGSTLVAIVVLIALPAAIVIGVFFLRKKKWRRS